METRKGKPAKALSESEIEEIQSRLNAKEAQLREQATLFQQQRDEFERRKQAFEQDAERIQCTLNDKDTELSKRLELVSEQEQAARRTMLLSPETVHESENKTAPAQSHPHGMHPPRLYDTNASAIYSPPDYGYEYNLPRISFREALESVPLFDGNNVPLSQFTRACRRARDIIPPAGERSLTRLLLNKLRGRAHLAVLDEPCDSITQLTDLLTGAFGVHKTIDQYRGELSTTFMKSSEHMLEYIGRIKDMRGSILDAERRRRGSLPPGVIQEIDALTARSFCDGLPFEYSSLVKDEHYVNPFEAFNFVKIISKRKELDKERLDSTRHGGRHTERHVHPIGKPLAQSTPAKSYNPREPLKYNEKAYTPARQSFGHSPRFTGENPWQDRGNNNTRTGQGNRLEPRLDDRRPIRSENLIVCRYCKTPGHSIDECRKRQYNNSMRSQGNPRPPPREKDEPRAGTAKESERPVRVIAEIAEETASRS